MTRLLLALAISTGAAAQPLITTVAGTDFVFHGDRQPALNVPLGNLAGVTVDPARNLYAVDIYNNIVVKVTTDGILHVIAGNGIAGFSGDGGPATSASINSGGGIAVDPAGNVYLADTNNSRVRKITPDGSISTVAGSHTCVDPAAIATCHGGDGGLAVDALLNTPFNVKLSSSGDLYIVDYGANRVRKVSPAGIITTFAGNGAADGAGDGGPASQASLITPLDAAFDSTGGLWILQSGKLSRVGSDGLILGSVFPDRFTGLAIDGANNLYLTDWVDEQIIKLTLSGDLSIVAGSGSPGFSGDGGPAVKAQLTLAVFVLGGLALDSSGSVYIADIDNFRIRKVTPDGNINTVAGNGQFGYSGEGAPAIQTTFSGPFGLAADGSGNLYIADGPGMRVRKMAADGTVTTFAGSGSPGFTGDGGPAAAASIYYPLATATDSAGGVYIVDALSRVRRVSPDGIITTVAGNGGVFAGNPPGDQFQGSSGPALQADLGVPLSVLGLAVDNIGNIYISETGNLRVRKITPDGTISTIAGGGSASGDNIPALSAALAEPVGLAVDAAGNIYVADYGNGVRKVTPDGMITTVAPLPDALGVSVDAAGNLYITSDLQIFQLSPSGALTVVAGNGKQGYTGDGGPAANATFNFSQYSGRTALDSQGNLYISDDGNRRIRMVLAAPPSVRTDVQALTFTANASGAPAPTQQFTVVGSVPLIGLTLSADTADGGKWLSVSALSGLTPLLVDVTADPAKLAPGSYQGVITVAAANAVPTQLKINVSFTVGPGLPAQLKLDQDHFSFAFPQGSFTRAQALTVFNTGGGPLAFTALAILDSGSPHTWLTLSPAAGTATPAGPVSIVVTANTAGLPAGTYKGRIVITTPASPSPTTVPVTVNVSTKPLSIVLSQSGQSFTSIAAGGVVPPQTFGVVSLGAGASPWTVEASSLSGGNWLSVDPPSGTLSATSPPVVTVSVNQQGLAPGRYYGLVKTRVQGAANTPQALTVFLDVQGQGTDLAAVLRPSELVFTAPAGESSPGAQEVQIYNLTGTPKSFVSASSASGGDPLFFHVLPSDGLIQPDTPGRILIQPNLGIVGQSNHLQPGTHRGTLTLQFSDGRVGALGITFIVTPSASASISAKNPSSHADAACIPTTLLPSIASLGSGFAVPGGWPLGVQVDVRDDCGAALESGAVTAEFSNGDPPLSLRALPGGRWEGTWQTRSAQTSSVTITVKARTALGNLSGLKQVSGGLGANQLPPVIAAGGIVNTASMAPQQPLAPGSAITILGDQLSDGQSTYSSVPVGAELAGTTVLMGDQTLPLLMTAPRQINALAPYGIEANTTHQVLVQRGLTYSQPVEVDIAPAQPAIFPKGILDASGAVVAAGNAAKAGDAITIYCTGLGEVTPPIAAGNYGPPLSQGATAVNPVTVSIGNVNAAVKFAGLAPGMIGVYQVQTTVPTGVTPGDTVPVSLTVQTSPPQSSSAVTIAVR